MGGCHFSSVMLPALAPSVFLLCPSCSVLLLTTWLKMAPHPSALQPLWWRKGGKKRGEHIPFCVCEYNRGPVAFLSCSTDQHIITWPHLASWESGQSQLYSLIATCTTKKNYSGTRGKETLGDDWSFKIPLKSTVLGPYREKNDKRFQKMSGHSEKGTTSSNSFQLYSTKHFFQGMLIGGAENQGSTMNHIWDMLG